MVQGVKNGGGFDYKEEARWNIFDLKELFCMLIVVVVTRLYIYIYGNSQN